MRDAWIMQKTTLITIDQMLDTAWDLFGKYFSPEELSIKQNLVDKYWKGKN